MRTVLTPHQTAVCMSRLGPTPHKSRAQRTCINQQLQSGHVCWRRGCACVCRVLSHAGHHQRKCLQQHAHRQAEVSDAICNHTSRLVQVKQMHLIGTCMFHTDQLITTEPTQESAPAVGSARSHRHSLTPKQQMTFTRDFDNPQITMQPFQKPSITHSNKHTPAPQQITTHQAHLSLWSV